MKLIIKSLIRKFSPPFFIEFIRKKRRIKRLESIRQNNERFELSDIVKVLNSLNINQCGNLFIHSGSDYFSQVNGGPFSVLKTILNYMDNGTIIMPAFPFDGLASEYLDNNNIFSVKKSPSKMGLLTELFRRTIGVIRSVHPTHSVCALGKNADFLTSGHENSIYPFDENSPFKKIIDLKGQILMIGVGLEVLTLVHAIEDELKDKFPVSVYQSKLRKVNIVDRQEKMASYNTLTHDPNISVRKNITQFENPLIENGIMKKQILAGIEFRLLDAYQLHKFLEKNALNNKTIYS